MVWADHNRLSLSFCLRRDVLSRLRAGHDGIAAAAVAFEHILRNCPAVRDALSGATLAGEWLAAGPIRPGIRSRLDDGVFRVGNVAGESHPIIAEGISMALQSGWLLAQTLAGHPQWTPAALRQAHRDYDRAWRRQFATRIGVAALLARLAIFPQSAGLMRQIVRTVPQALSIGALLSGKTKALPGF